MTRPESGVEMKTHCAVRHPLTLASRLTRSARGGCTAAFGSRGSGRQGRTTPMSNSRDEPLAAACRGPTAKAGTTFAPGFPRAATPTLTTEPGVAFDAHDRSKGPHRPHRIGFGGRAAGRLAGGVRDCTAANSRAKTSANMASRSARTTGSKYRPRPSRAAAVEPDLQLSRPSPQPVPKVGTCSGQKSKWLPS